MSGPATDGGADSGTDGRVAGGADGEEAGATAAGGGPAVFLHRAERAGHWLENLFLVTLLGAMIVLAAGQVLLRQFSLPALVWGDEALRLMVLWIAMVGGVAASRGDAHLRIDVLARFLRQPWRSLVAMVVDLFTALVTGILAWYSFRFVAESREFEDVLFGSLPAWPFQAVLPAGFALITWRYGIWAARRVHGLLTGTTT